MAINSPKFHYSASSLAFMAKAKGHLAGNFPGLLHKGMLLFLAMFATLTPLRSLVIHVSCIPNHKNRILGTHKGFLGYRDMAMKGSCADSLDDLGCYLEYLMYF